MMLHVAHYLLLLFNCDRNSTKQQNKFNLLFRLHLKLSLHTEIIQSSTAAVTWILNSKLNIEERNAQN